MTTQAITPSPGTDQLGRPRKDLRISVTDRCNFRCPYCMPAEIFGDRYQFLPKPEILNFEEIERLVRIFARGGVNKVRITGGEPLLRADLSRLIESLAGVDGIKDLTLTTNGYLLADRVETLREAGLTRITVSLDSLDEAVFRHMSGGNFSPELVLEAIKAAEGAGLKPIKINCVVQKGVNDHTIVDLAKHFRGSGHIVRFIEFMDVGTLNGWDLAQVTSAKEIIETIDALFPLQAVEPAYRGEVARRYRYADGGGEIGVISSVTQPFCGDCTRARLTTDGRLVTCLFAQSGTDLKTPLRAGASDEELANLIDTTWSARTDRYSELRTAQTGLPEGTSRDKPKIEMYQVGG